MNFEKIIFFILILTFLNEAYDTSNLYSTPKQTNLSPFFKHFFSKSSTPKFFEDPPDIREKDNQVPKEDGCLKLTPHECVDSTSCIYDCGGDQCLTGRASPTCPEGKAPIVSSPYCGNFCYDPCGCRAEKGCFYNSVTHKCTGYNFNTDISFFNDTRCYHYYAHYHRAGVDRYFYQYHKKVEADHCTAVRGITFGGKNKTIRMDDKLGNGKIYYIPASTMPYDDPFRIVKFGGTTKEIEFAKEAKLKELMQSWIEADPTMARPGRCATWYVSLNRAGFYEGCLHAMEPVYESRGLRRFNVRFNNILVFHELDILEPSDPAVNLQKIDHCFQFEITDDFLQMFFVGIPTPQRILDPKRIPLAFCYGRCSSTVVDPSFVIPAFLFRGGCMINAEKCIN